MTHQCLHAHNWGKVKANLATILTNIQELKEHDKSIARLQVWVFVQWAAIGGMFIWNLRLHGLW
jgi:hypothetical protein